MRGSVAAKGGFATIWEPIDLGIFTLECIKEQLLVIASKANDLVGRPFLKIQEELDDPATIGASIDVITEKDELRSLCSGILLAKGD